MPNILHNYLVAGDLVHNEVLTDRECLHCWTRCLVSHSRLISDKYGDVLNALNKLRSRCRIIGRNVLKDCTQVANGADLKPHPHTRRY